MNIYTTIRRQMRKWNFLFLLGSVLSLSAVIGCRDSMLPPVGSDTTHPHSDGRILVSTAGIHLSAGDALHVFTLIPGTNIPGDNGGRDPIDLAFDTYTISPSSTDGKVALLDYLARTIAVYNGNTGEHYLPDISLASDTRLTDFSLTISPDGERIAYQLILGESGGANNVTKEIIIAETDGTVVATTDVVSVAPGNPIRFSPDGSKIAFFALTPDFDAPDYDPLMPRRGTLYVGEITGSTIQLQEVAQVEDAGNSGLNPFDWSPDGTRLVYTDAQHNDMYIINSDGTGQQHLGFGIGPDWSPDGSQIIFTQENMKVGILTIDPNGITSQSLDIKGLYPRWSPDGGKILYFELPNGIFTGFQQLMTVRTLDLTTQENLQVVVTYPPYAHWLG